MSVFFILFMVYILIFALLGMELFAFSVFHDADKVLIVGKSKIEEAYEGGTRLFEPIDNFNSIGKAIFTVFLLVIGDDWPTIATPYIRASREDGEFTELIAYSYFMILLVTGHVVLLALLTALLLKNFK